MGWSTSARGSSCHRRHKPRHYCRGSEYQLQRELNLSRDISAANRPERRRGEVRLRSLKVGVVEQIEKLRAELQIHPFPEAKALVYAQVPLLQVRGAEGIAAEVAIGLGIGRQCERRLVEIVVQAGRAPRSVGFADEVRAETIRPPDIAYA